MAKKRKRKKNPTKNHSGLGAFLGSFVGTVPGALVRSAPIGMIGSVAGGAIGGALGSKPDRKKRGAAGGAIGGMLGPLGAALGGYVAGQKPDAKKKRKKKNPAWVGPVVLGTVALVGIGGIATVMGVRAIKRRRAAALQPTTTPTKLPPSDLPIPAPAPTEQPGEPDALWEVVDRYDCGTQDVVVFQDLNWTDDSVWAGPFRVDRRWNPFVQYYKGDGTLSAASGLKNEKEATSLATGSPCDNFEILEDVEVPQGRNVAYFDTNHGVVMEHRADPLSPTGVKISWWLFSRDTAPGSPPIVGGSASTEEQAKQEAWDAAAQASA